MHPDLPKKNSYGYGFLDPNYDGETISKESLVPNDEKDTKSTEISEDFQILDILDETSKEVDELDLQGTVTNVTLSDLKSNQSDSAFGFKEESETWIPKLHENSLDSDDEWKSQVIKSMKLTSVRFRHQVYRERSLCRDGYAKVTGGWIRRNPLLLENYGGLNYIKKEVYVTIGIIQAITQKFHLESLCLVTILLFVIQV